MRSSLLFLALSLMLAADRAGGEQLVIDLAAGQNDPLIEYVPPPPGSRDRSVFTAEGLFIKQLADQPRVPTGVTGFKSGLAARGDFSIKLDAKVIRIDPPTDGWGQGLMLMVFLDDPESTVMKISQVCFAGGKRVVTYVEVKRRGENPHVQQTFPVAINEGSLAIRRQGEEATFTIATQDGSQDLMTIPCIDADVRTVEVWSTRLDQGNAAAEMLLRKLTVDAELFYSFQQVKSPWISGYHLIIGVQALVLVGAVTWSLRRGRKQV